jgi:hypothetical protein
VWLQAARRIVLIWAAILVGTVALSALVGLASGSGVQRPVSIGLYLAGVVLLAGCFVVGARGPLRGVSREGETVPLVSARGVRRASGEERSESARIAILLFVLGLALVVIGSVVDPTHKAF